METISLEYTDVFDENKIKTVSFEKSSINEEFNTSSLFATMVDGQSMQPLISHKAILIVDISKKDLIDKENYLIYYENKMWIKRYEKKSESFVSINPKYKHLVYTKNDVHIVGKVILYKNC